MAKSSIHFSEVYPNSEVHNTREIIPDYALDIVGENDSFIKSSISKAKKEAHNFRSTIVANDRAKGNNSRGLRSDAKIIREAVVNLNAHHTMDDLKRLSKEIESEFGMAIFQIHIHRDEGKSINERNYHAHILAKWQDQTTGKVLRLDKLALSRLQDVTARVLGMERGVSGGERLEHAEYRKLAQDLKEAKKKTIIKRLNPFSKFSQRVSEFLNLFNSLNTKKNKEITLLNELKKKLALQKQKYLSIPPPNKMKKLQELKTKENLLNKQLMNKKTILNAIKQREKQQKKRRGRGMNF